MRDIQDDAPLDGSIGEGFDEYLFYLITQVHSRRVRDFSPVLEMLDLSIAHWRALSTINRLDGCLMSELSEFTTVDRTTLTRTVDQLVETGLVVRQTTPDDRRLVRVLLTDEGRALFGRAVDGLVAHNARTLDGLSADDLRALRGLLQRLLKNIMHGETGFPAILAFSRS